MLSCLQHFSCLENHDNAEQNYIMNKIIDLKSLFFLVKNNAIISVLSYFLTIFLANYFGPEIFGTYSSVLIIASALSILLSYQTESIAPVMHAMKRTNEYILRNIIFCRLYLFISLLFLSLFLSFFLNYELIFFIICLLPASLNLSFFYEIKYLNKRYSYIFLFERVAYISLVLLAFYLKALSIFLIFFISLITILGSLYFQFRDCGFFKSKISAPKIKCTFSILKMNFPLVIISLSLFAYGGFSRLILENKLSTEWLGIYSAGWQIVTIASIYQSQITRIWRVGIVKSVNTNNLIDLKNLIFGYFIFSTLPLLLITLFIYFKSSFIVNLLYSSKYSKLEPLLPYFSFYMVTINVFGLVELLWLSFKRYNLYMVINLFFSILLILFLFLLPNGTNPKFFILITTIVQTLAAIFLLFFWIRLSKINFNLNSLI